MSAPAGLQQVIATGSATKLQMQFPLEPSCRLLVIWGMKSVFLEELGRQGRSSGPRCIDAIIFRDTTEYDVFLCCRLCLSVPRTNERMHFAAVTIKHMRLLHLDLDIYHQPDSVTSQRVANHVPIVIDTIAIDETIHPSLSHLPNSFRSSILPKSLSKSIVPSTRDSP